MQLKKEFTLTQNQTSLTNPQKSLQLARQLNLMATQIKAMELNYLSQFVTGQTETDPNMHKLA